MKLDFKECKNLIGILKGNKKLRVIEDDKPHGFGNDGVDSWSYTILESSTLKILYATHNFYHSNDISVIDKERETCIYSNSPYPEELGTDRMKKIDINTLDELMRCIEERL